MESSRSTPGRSVDGPVPLFVWVTGEDHPRACTGRRLIRSGLVRRVEAPSVPGRPLVLDPRASTPLSRADSAAAGSGGILAVDCSWNLLESRGSLPGPLAAQARSRRLPWLVATNPQHYGRWSQLNTAEALAAALFVVGESGQGSRLLAPFAGASEFWKVNAARLERYRQAENAEGVLLEERSAR